LSGIVKVKISNKARHILSLQGVPSGLLQPFSLKPDDLLQNFPLPSVNECDATKWIDTDTQLDWLNLILEDLPITPYTLMCINTPRFFKARQLALLLFWRYLVDSMNHPRTYHDSLPIWRSVNLNFRNYLLEEYASGKHTRPNLLVIDGVYHDMPNIKCDKLHDIMQTLCDRPRILIFHGPDPFNFCVNALGTRPTYILNMDAPPPALRTRAI